MGVLNEGTKAAEHLLEKGSHLENYIRDAATGAFKGKKGSTRLSEFHHLGMGNMEHAVESGGFSSAWSMAGHHAIRGAIAGGAIGGTTEALNGGSFWDGAKAGAFKGASIYTGLRMGQAYTGAESLNPLAGKGRGMLSGAHNMWAVTGGKNVKMSKQAAAILGARTGDGFNIGVNNLYAASK